MQEHLLVVRLRSLLKQQAGLDVAVLETLAEVFEQKVHLALGFQSLHDFCVSGLGMSDDSAWRRRKAADLLRRYPGLVRSLIEEREVHLTGLARLHAVITDDNAERLLNEARGKTKAEIEVIVVREAPKPDLTSGVRSVFKAEPSPLVLNASSQWGSSEETAPVRNEVPVASSKQQPVELRSPDRYAFRAMMSQETKAVLDEVCDLSSDHDLEAVLRDALLAYREELLVKKRKKLKRPPPRRPGASGTNAENRKPTAANRTPTAVGREPNADSRTPTAEHREPTAERRNATADSREPIADDRKLHAETRYVDAETTRLVFDRDKHCQFVSDNGHKCCSTKNLQLHHIHAWAKGGPATPENLKVFCRAHNLYQGELEIGPRLAA